MFGLANDQRRSITICRQKHWAFERIAEGL